jgi:hypothetical protein
MQTLFIIAIVLGFYCLSVALCLVFGRLINKKRFIPGGEALFFVNFIPVVNIIFYLVVMTFFIFGVIWDILRLDKYVDKMYKFFAGE